MGSLSIATYISSSVAKWKVSSATKSIESLSREPSEDLVREFYKTNSDSVKLAILSVMSKRVLNLKPYKNQLYAALMSSEGYVLDMKTGEGKTLVACLSACLLSQKFHTVRVATANPYLSSRDYDWMRPLFAAFGINVTQDSSNCVDKAVIYSTLNECCHSWLEDHLHLSLDLDSHDFSKTNAILIDEIDLSLIDTSITPFSITNSVKISTESMVRALEVCTDVERNEFVYDHDNGSFNEEFFDELLRIYTTKFDATKTDFFSKYAREIFSVQAAYIARNVLKMGVDYAIMDGEICIIESNTGRTRRGGFPPTLLMALQLKESLDITEKVVPYLSSALPNYIKRYSFISGMSGTASVNANELEHIYGLSVVSVPLNQEKALHDHGYILLSNEKDKLEFTVSEVLSRSYTGRPSLVICENENQAQKVYDKLINSNLDVDLLCSRNLSEEHLLIGKAGKSGHVLVTTRLCGRGTDIVIGNSVEEKDSINSKGGLFVIALSAGETIGDDLQLRGRCARQNDSGEVMVLTSMEDKVVLKNPIAKLILHKCVHSISDVDKVKIEKSNAVAKAIKQVQARNQSASKDMRGHLMLFDQPVSQQLEVFSLFRTRIKEAKSFGSLLTLLGSDSDNELLALELDLGKYSSSAEVLALAKDVSLRHMISKWELHNATLTALKNEQIHSAQGGYFKFKEACKSAFENFAEPLKTEIVRDILLHLNAERQMHLAQSSLLTTEEISLIKELQIGY